MNAYYTGVSRKWKWWCSSSRVTTFWNSPDECQLAYSADMWLSQLVSFVQEVILSPQTKSESTATFYISPMPMLLVLAYFYLDLGHDHTVSSFKYSHSSPLLPSCNIIGADVTTAIIIVFAGNIIFHKCHHRHCYCRPYCCCCCCLRK